MLKKLRTDKGISASTLGKILGKAESTVRTWEIGKAQPDLNTLIKLAEYFECTTDYLLGVSDDISKKKLKELANKYKGISEHLEKLEIPHQVRLLTAFEMATQGYTMLRKTEKETLGKETLHEKLIHLLESTLSYIKQMCEDTKRLDPFEGIFSNMSLPYEEEYTLPIYYGETDNIHNYVHSHIVAGLEKFADAILAFTLEYLRSMPINESYKTMTEKEMLTAYREYQLGDRIKNATQSKKDGEANAT